MVGYLGPLLQYRRGDRRSRFATTSIPVHWLGFIIPLHEFAGYGIAYVECDPLMTKYLDGSECQIWLALEPDVSAKVFKQLFTVCFALVWAMNAQNQIYRDFSIDEVQWFPHISSCILCAMRACPSQANEKMYIFVYCRRVTTHGILTSLIYSWSFM